MNDCDIINEEIKHEMIDFTSKTWEIWNFSLTLLITKSDPFVLVSLIFL